MLFLPFLVVGQNSFKSGEFFKYRLRYGVFNTSQATLTLSEKDYKGKKVYHAYGEGRTTGLARVFFKVDDIYESYFDKNTITPYYFNRDIYEGGYTKKLNFFFNQDNHSVLIKDLETKSQKNISIEASVKDVMTALYYFREFVDTASLKEGQEVSLDMIFDDDEIFKFKLKFLAREEIDTKFGRMKALKFRPLVQDGRVFKEQESLTLWVSDDKNRIPLKVSASLRVGSIVGELIEYRNLKN